MPQKAFKNHTMEIPRQDTKKARQGRQKATDSVLTGPVGDIFCLRCWRAQKSRIF